MAYSINVVKMKKEHISVQTSIALMYDTLGNPSKTRFWNVASVWISAIGNVTLASDMSYSIFIQSPIQLVITQTIEGKSNYNP